MGQARVRRWTEYLLSLTSTPADPLAVLHPTPLAADRDAPHGYELFRDKSDGCTSAALEP